MKGHIIEHLVGLFLLDLVSHSEQRADEADLIGVIRVADQDFLHSVDDVEQPSLRELCHLGIPLVLLVVCPFTLIQQVFFGWALQFGTPPLQSQVGFQSPPCLAGLEVLVEQSD